LIIAAIHRLANRAAKCKSVLTKVNTKIYKPQRRADFRGTQPHGEWPPISTVSGMRRDAFGGRLDRYPERKSRMIGQMANFRLSALNGIQRANPSPEASGFVTQGRPRHARGKAYSWAFRRAAIARTDMDHPIENAVMGDDG
jgi:hypothetical protein